METHSHILSKLEQFCLFHQRVHCIVVFFPRFFSVWFKVGLNSSVGDTYFCGTNQDLTTFKSEPDESWWFALSLLIKSDQTTPTNLMSKISF